MCECFLTSDSGGPAREWRQWLDVATRSVSRDIVVVGASAGGLEPLRRLVAHLPADLPAAVFIVLHIAATGRSVLPGILSRAGPLPAAHAKHGETIQHGRIYVAPPDQHLLLHDGHVEVIRGPKENGHRPAIDPLFRSAAEHFGPRVTGVVLSGALDDGAAGLRRIRQAGGAGIVQDPGDAMYDSMPKAAIANAEPDDILDSAKLGDAVTRLARRTTEEEAMSAASANSGSNGDEAGAETGEDPRPGLRSAYACPDCGGGLWEVEDGGLLRFECRVGHAFSEASMLERQNDAVETALWTSVRIIEERVAYSRRLSERLAARGSSASAGTFARQADEAESCARQLKHLLQTIRLAATPAAVAD